MLYMYIYTCVFYLHNLQTSETYVNSNTLLHMPSNNQLACFSMSIDNGRRDQQSAATVHLQGHKEFRGHKLRT